MTTKATSPSVIASIILPLFIVISFWTTINSPISEDANKLPTKIQKIDNRFSKIQPDVILVGSSLANKAINSDAIAKQLGLEQDKVQILWSGMAAMPAIYLMIENRILAQNLEPKVVAILSPPVWLTTTAVLQDTNFALHQTQPLSPLLADVLNKEIEDPSTWKQRKSDFQNGYKEWIQAIAGEMILDESKENIDTQLDKLFAAENQRQNVKDNQLIQHNIRETETQREQEQTYAHDIRLLDSIAQQLKERNIHLVVVTLPVSRTVHDGYALDDTKMLELVNTLEKNKATYIDLFDWDERNIFADTKHMSFHGQKLFTTLLAQKWIDMGVLTANPTIAKAPVKLFKPTISNLDRGRLSPSGTIDITFPVSLAQVSITACLSSSKPTATTAFKESTKRTGNERLWCEDIKLSNIVASQTIFLQNQSESLVQIHSIKLDNSELLEQPNSIFATMNEWSLDESSPTERFPITEATQWPKWLRKKRADFPALQLGKFAQYQGLSDITLAKNGLPLECRPIILRQKDQILPLSQCKELWTSHTGYCIKNTNLITIQDTHVVWDSLSVGLKDNRLCHLSNRKAPTGYWIFPSDTSSTVFNWPKGNYSRVQIEGISVGKGTWRIELFDGSTVFLDKLIEESLDKEIELLLDTPMLQKHANLQVRISVPKESNTNLFIQRIEVKN